MNQTSMPTYYYSAFGMNLCSQCKITMLPEKEAPEHIDVSILYTELSYERSLIKENIFVDTRPGYTFFYISEVGNFLIQNGNSIQIDPEPDVPEGLLAVYIMGSCFGAILHQRHLLPIHGSCVTDGKYSILITGDSGAGKSTLAAEFMSHGWKLVTDDVSVIKGIKEQHPVVQSSYPSQKLWTDTKNKFDRSEETFLLFQEQRRDKFGILVNDFYEGTAPLHIIVRLIPSDQACVLEPIEGFTKVDQLMYNTYRAYYIPPEDRSEHFQNCISLASQVQMFHAIRNNDYDCSHQVYLKLTEKLMNLT